MGALHLELVDTRSRLGTARFASIEDLVSVEIDGTPLAGLVSAAQRPSIIDDLGRVLRLYLGPGGEMALPIRAHLAAAAKTGT